MKAPPSDKQCYLHFLRSPKEVVADEQGERVAGVKLELNELEVGQLSSLHCSAVPCGAVVMCVS